jgi:hypothetical protein
MVNFPKELTLAASPSLSRKGYVETLGWLYYKRVPLPRIQEHRDLSRDSQLLKPAVEIMGVEPNITSKYPNRYKHIFGLLN